MQEKEAKKTGRKHASRRLHPCFPDYVFRYPQDVRRPARRDGYTRGWLRIRLRRDGGDFGGVDVDEAAALALVLEADDAGDLGEEGVVLAAANVGAGLQRRSTLADDDGAAEDSLAAEALDAEPLGV